MIVIYEMPADRITDREGRWYLRHVRLDDGSQAFLLSVSAPKGTRAEFLEPGFVELLPSDDWETDTGTLHLPVEDLRELLKWPPQ